MKRKKIPEKLKKHLLDQSGHRCVVCGAHDYLHIHHIVPTSLGGPVDEENLVVLCPTCHASVDRSQMQPDVLKKMKARWIEEHIQGRTDVVEMAGDLEQDHGILSAKILQKHVVLHELAHWSMALSTYADFDHQLESILKEIEAIPNEDTFLKRTLKPLFESLGFDGVTVIHHTGKPERGKDLVFYDRDRLGALTFYAVVACVGKIHANAAKTRDSGHYQKLLDQIAKCFLFPYRECNLKASFFIDKVIVACSSTITDEAVEAFQMWEEKERRHLIYLSGPDIAGIRLKMSLSPTDRQAQ